MSERKWTPGEWSVDFMDDYEDGTDLVVLDSDGFPIATVEATPILHKWSEKYPDMDHWARGADDGRTARERSREEYAANAALIGASKHLYEALEGLVAALCHEHNKHLPYWQDALAALSRSTGQE